MTKKFKEKISKDFHPSDLLEKIKEERKLVGSSTIFVVTVGEVSVTAENVVAVVSDQFIRSLFCIVAVYVAFIREC